VNGVGGSRVHACSPSLRLSERLTRSASSGCGGHHAAVTMSAEEPDVYDHEIRDTVEHYEQ
jgi:hypothetical protein